MYHILLFIYHTALLLKHTAHFLSFLLSGSEYGSSIEEGKNCELGHYQISSIWWSQVCTTWSTDYHSTIVIMCLQKYVPWQNQVFTAMFELKYAASWHEYFCTVYEINFKYILTFNVMSLTLDFSYYLHFP